MSVLFGGVKRVIDVISVLWTLAVFGTGLAVYFSGEGNGLFMLSMSIPALLWLGSRRKFYRDKKIAGLNKRLQKEQAKEEQQQLVSENTEIVKNVSLTGKSKAKGRITALSIAIIIISIAGYYFYYNSYESIAKREVMAELKDPDSAQFSDVESIANIVQGTVRAKNSFGGYVVSEFEVVFADHDKTVLAVNIE